MLPGFEREIRQDREAEGRCWDRSAHPIGAMIVRGGSCSTGGDDGKTLLWGRRPRRGRRDRKIDLRESPAPAGEWVQTPMDAELKRDARAVIERITQLRDSL